MPVVIDAEASFAVTVPVVIVGAGATGLTAALAAREAGAEVLILEADGTPMGSTAMSQGKICAAGTAAQRAHGVDDSPELMFADIMARTGDRADPLLARIIAQESGPTVDWLNGKGVTLSLDTAFVGFGHSRRRVHATPQRIGTELMGLLLTAVEASGADLITHAHVVDVVATPEGRVLGVRFRRPDGQVEAVGCGALVLATCGFGGNPEMIRSHIPAMAEATYFGWESNRGEGIAWGQALGGAVGDMDSYQGLGLLAEPQRVVVDPIVLMEGGVTVNVTGARFQNELVDVSGQGRRVSAQPGGVAWVIHDARIAGLCAGLHEYRQLAETGALRQADSADALAQLTGIDGAGLTATLAALTRMAAGSATDPLGRDFTVKPPLAPPYIAIKVCGALFHTQGGLVVDGDAQVLRPDGAKLPNLFAGGGAARSISGPGESGYLPAAGLCMAVTLGRLAGRAAASLALTQPRPANVA